MIPKPLMDYKNYIRPTRGFKPDVIHDLAKKTAEFEAEERFLSYPGTSILVN